MKKTRFFSAMLAICMMFTVLPVLSLAQAAETKKMEIRHLMGDVTLDGMLNTGDATFILKWAADAIEFSDGQLAIADANMDDEINTADATYVLKVAADMAEPLYRVETMLESFEVSYVLGLSEEIDVTIPMAEMVEEESTYIVAEAPVFATENADYTFLGWYSSIDGNDYQPGAEFVMPSQAVVFIAHWDGIELPTVEPTVDPTTEPTTEPTVEPTTEPTVEPTVEPTEPIEGEAKVSLKLYDSFNAENVTTTEMSVAAGTTTITSANIKLPEGYVLANPNFSATVTAENGIATPSAITVNVIPVTMIDGVQYYIIKNNTGFNNVNKNLEGNYAMDTDIDLGNRNRMPFGWFWDDLTVDDTEFTGVFDGQGHIVTGLYIDYTNNYHTGADPYDFYTNVGLFACNKGTIKNLSVYTKLYDGQTVEYGVFGDVNVGIIAGTNNGKIENCHAYGNAGTLDYIEMDRAGAGGLVGSNSGTITRCSFEGGVEGFYWVGGLVGKNFGTITESYTACGVNSALDDEIVYDFSVRYIGGLCGGAQDATIKDCYILMTDDIYGDRAIGGMIGWSSRGNYSNIYVASLGGVVAYQTGDYGVDVGYLASNPTSYSGLYAADGTSLSLPNEYSKQVWDMNGACYNKLPDLINNRRAKTLFTEEN